jgi:glycosyltransferase involved in cell wall biosynthesis
MSPRGTGRVDAGRTAVDPVPHGRRQSRPGPEQQMDAAAVLRGRPRIAFFDYPDVFEDFYPHYGVSQRTFATRWAGTGSHAFASLLQREIGDVVWYAFSVAPELGEARHEVTGCRVRMLQSSWLHRRLWRAFYLPRMSWRWNRAYPVYAPAASYLSLASWPFIRALRRDRPDVFFVQDYATGRFDVLLTLARVFGVPLIAFHSGSRPEQYLGRLAKRWTIRRADRLLVSSREESEMLARRYRVEPERLALILTPIDTVGFRPLGRTEACRAARLDPARRHVLFVGRLDDAVKRIGALIRVFATLASEHTDTDLVIVGDGRDGAMLRSLVEDKAPGRVRFVGWVAGAESLAPFYNAAECLVLPSLREGFPTVVGEALACGVPVLASRVGGVAELVIEGKTGWLLPPGDDHALRAGLAAVLSNPGAVAAMRPDARALAEERVSPTVIAAALRQCFAEVMERRHG